jgi:hypothetical protein
VKKRAANDGLGWGALMLVPSIAGLKLSSGFTESYIAAWVVMGMLYLLVLGELRHRRDERRHVSAIIFALLGCLLNVFVAVAGLAFLVFTMGMGN